MTPWLSASTRAADSPNRRATSCKLSLPLACNDTAMQMPLVIVSLQSRRELDATASTACLMPAGVTGWHGAGEKYKQSGGCCTSRHRILTVLTIPYCCGFAKAMYAEASPGVTAAVLVTGCPWSSRLSKPTGHCNCLSSHEDALRKQYTMCEVCCCTQESVTVAAILATAEATTAFDLPRTQHSCRVWCQTAQGTTSHSCHFHRQSERLRLLQILCYPILLVSLVSNCLGAQQKVSHQGALCWVLLLPEALIVIDLLPVSRIGGGLSRRLLPSSSLPQH